MKRRRTLADENRNFNAEWEVFDFVIETADHCKMCLICKQVLKTLKGDNARQHYLDMRATLTLSWTESRKNVLRT